MCSWAHAALVGARSRPLPAAAAPAAVHLRAAVPVTMLLHCGRGALGVVSVAAGGGCGRGRLRQCRDVAAHAAVHRGRRAAPLLTGAATRLSSVLPVLLVLGSPRLARNGLLQRDLDHQIAGMCLIEPNGFLKH